MDHALVWHMKYKSNASLTQPRTLQDIKQALLRDFHRTNSASQCMTKLKEIKQRPNESIKEYD